MAELARELLAGGEVEEAVRLKVVRPMDDPGADEAIESYEPCGYGACGACGRENNSAPDCRTCFGTVEKHPWNPQALVAGKHERHNLLTEVGARAADGAGANELVRGEGP